MLSVIQTAGFLDQPFFQSKLMKQSHFLHVDTNLQKSKVNQKFFVCSCSKTGV